MVLDDCAFANPFAEDGLRMLTGNDEPVAQFIGIIRRRTLVLAKEEDLLEMLFATPWREGKKPAYIISVVYRPLCVSVYIANKLAAFSARAGL